VTTGSLKGLHTLVVLVYSIAILWKGRLQATPVHSNYVLTVYVLTSDHICAIKLEGSSSSDPCLTLIAVYLPSTDYALEVL
jgi:hypothetical protein